MNRNNAIKKITTIEADIPSTMNIATAQAIPPTKAVCQSKNLNEGLKFGAEAIFSKKQARLVTINVIKKAIVIYVAIWLTLANKHN